MILGKSGITLRLRVDDETHLCVEVVDAMLPRKSSKLQVTDNRTVNRHR